MREWVARIAPGLVVLAWSAVRADDAPKPPAPQIKLTVPLVITAGKEAELTVRGTGLDAATNVKFTGEAAPISATIKSKAKAGPPNGLDVARAGDTELKLVLNGPDDLPPGEHAFVVSSEHGESRPHKLTIVAAGTLIDEKEPNDGFSQAQPIETPRTIRGTIERGQDVDVFAIAGPAGERVVVEVLAARRGSPADILLTAYASRSRILATVDDVEGSRDPRLELEIPPEGRLLLSVMDANDTGSSLHGYELRIRPE